MSCCSPSSQDPPKKPKLGIHSPPLSNFNFKATEKKAACCCSNTSGKQKFDYLLWGSLLLVITAYVTHLFLPPNSPLPIVHFCSGVFELFNKMWWGLTLGIFAVGALGWVPKEWVASILGKPGSTSGIIRAMLAGLLLDLCNHGILLVAMKLYERGASLGQTLAFLIASPWNSLSLTIILFSLIGMKWTLLFILLSALIAFTTGIYVEVLTKNKRLPINPNSIKLPSNFHLWKEIRSTVKLHKINHTLLIKMIRSGMTGSRMILRWIFLGTILAAGVRAFIPQDIFITWFGPTEVGLLLTLVAAAIIEVCSEGSSPIAADLITRGQAPGNAFTFLMAGAATDYTEIMALKETTRSWKATLILPALTIPQVLLIAWLINHF